MNVYEAMKELKEGAKVRRTGWNDISWIKLAPNGKAYSDAGFLVGFCADDVIEEDWEVVPQPYNSSVWKEGKDGQSIIASIPDRPLDPTEGECYGGQVICESVSKAHQKRIIDCCNALRGIPYPGRLNIQKARYLGRGNAELLKALGL